MNITLVLLFVRPRLLPDLHHDNMFVTHMLQVIRIYVQDAIASRPPLSEEGEL